LALWVGIELLPERAIFQKIYSDACLITGVSLTRI
jgi:hypothetical protein